jgi:hypothetical protein
MWERFEERKLGWDLAKPGYAELVMAADDRYAKYLREILGKTPQQVARIDRTYRLELAYLVKAHLGVPGLDEIFGQ